jgi:hypothetical protein
MICPEEIFPNIARLALSRDICYFLDWALAVHGAQLSNLATGKFLDVTAIVAEFVDVDYTRLEVEMLHLEQVLQPEPQSGRKAN